MLLIVSQSFTNQYWTAILKKVNCKTTVLNAFENLGAPNFLCLKPTVCPSSTCLQLCSTPVLLSEFCQQTMVWA